MYLQTELAPEFQRWNDFKSILNELNALLKIYGVRKPLVGDKNRDLFLRFSVDRQVSLLGATRRQVDIYRLAQMQEVSLDNSKDLLKIALNHMGLLVDNSIFTHLKSTDIVELYSADHIQIFRTFNFFSVCNYNLDDVLLNEWFELYERAPNVTDECIQVVVDHLNQDHAISPIHLKPHLMRERFSNPQGAFEITFKYIATAFKGPGRKDGYVISQSCVELGVTHRSRVLFLNSQA